MSKQPRLPLGGPPEQMQLPGASWFKGEFERLPHFEAGAHSYRAAQDLAPADADQFAGTKFNPDSLYAIGGVVARQEGKPTHMSPQLEQSYGALRAGIDQQFTHLTTPKERGGMGVNVEFTPHDPYPDPVTMRDEVRRTGTLKILSTETTGGHPILGNEGNDRFRAVHDAFGHLATGRNFTANGEEGAAQHHATMFPPEAHKALFSELRAQTAAVTRAGSFPEQRAYDLPNWASSSKPGIPLEPRERRVLSQQQRFF
jgi:hypothetical protein